MPGCEPPGALILRTERSLEEYLRDAPRAASLLGPDAPPADIPAEGEFEVPGYCHVDRMAVAFRMDERYSTRTGDRVEYSWRERMVCPRCTLNNRMRASIHVFEAVCRPHAGSRIWTTEQTTPFFTALARRYPRAVGSEYLDGGRASGWISERGIRHEDLSATSFNSDSLDAVLSFDVLEHIPDLGAALRETCRILAPGGVFLFTAPFLYTEHATRTRAERMPDGSTRHLWPAQYHGDPVNPDAGVLCYREFGWDVLEALRSAGFADAYALMYRSTAYGYPGGTHLIFAAFKRAGLVGALSATLRRIAASGRPPGPAETS